MNIDHDLPSNVGVDPKSLINIIKELDKCFCHSIMILRHDKIICEGWWKPYNQNYPHVLFSLSKTFLATAVCFAVQENLISFDDFVIKFFPEYFPSLPCENMQKVQIKHLLTMSYGRNVELDPDFYYRKDWLEENLHPYLYNEPGTKFCYDNRCPYIISVILQKVTGMTALDYLDSRLFKHLGIEKPFWEEKNGYNIGRSGLNLKTEDVAKFGLFLLHKGNYKGKQLLNSYLVEKMTSHQIQTYDENRPNYGAGYGYFVWMCQVEGAYRGSGIGSQLLINMPKQDMTVVVTAGFLDGAETILKVIFDNLIGKLDNSSVLSNIELLNENQKLLDSKLNGLSIPFISSKYHIGSGLSDLGDSLNYSDVIYDICQNRPNIVRMSIVFGEKSDVLKLWVLGNSAEPSENPPKTPVLLILNVGHDEWLENETNFEISNFHAHSTIFFSDVACSSKWLSKNEYAVKFVYTQTPYTDTLRIKFGKDWINGEYICFPCMKNRGESFQIMGVQSNKY